MTDPRVTRFRDLVAKQPANEMFRFSLAQALESADQTDEAEEHYRSCVKAKTDWMLPRIRLGKLLLKQGRADQAKPLLAEALKLAIDQDHEDPAAELQQILADLT